MRRLTVLFCIVFSTFAAAQDEQRQQTLFTNVNIFNGTDDRLYENHSVLVEGNLIRSISAGTITVGDDATLIDGGGRTLMPGLIDAYVHLNMLAGNSPAEMENATWDEIASAASVTAVEYLESGFTTVRGMGSIWRGLGLKKGTIDKPGIMPGPRIYPSASYISQTAGHGDLVLSSQQIRPQSKQYD